MSSIGSLLLGLRGMTDPTSSAIAEILRGGVGTPSPGTTTPAPTGAGPSAPPTGVPTQAPRSPVYDSPPDLLALYSQLSDFQSRQKRIDNGLALAGSAFVHPENRQLVASLFGGGESAVDPLSLTMQLGQFRADQEAKKAAEADAQRQLNALPAISEQYGIDPETARYLFDTGNLDEYILEAQKAKAEGRKTEIWNDKSTGKDFLIDQTDGTVIKELGGGPAPNRQLVTDPKSGQMRVVDINDPANANLGGGLAPSPEQKLFDEMKAAGTLPPGVETLAQMLEWKANLKKTPDTSVTIDNSGDKLLAGFDEGTVQAVNATDEDMKLLSQLEAAKATLSSDAGIVSGNVLSQVTSETRKFLASALGLSDEAANNTDVLMAQMKNLVLPKMKDLRPASDIDVQLVESIVGGSQALTPDTIMRLINAQEVDAKKRILMANSKAQKRVDLETDPAKKAKLQAAFDARRNDLPDYSPEQLAVVDPSDVEALRKAIASGDKNAIDQFDATYGMPGLAEQILRGS